MGLPLPWFLDGMDTDMVKQTINGLRKCLLKWFHGANVCKLKLMKHLSHRVLLMIHKEQRTLNATKR